MMDNTCLHAQKMVILTRLIKEKQLSIEEVLVLLSSDSSPRLPIIESSDYWITTTTAPKWVEDDEDDESTDNPDLNN